MRAGVVLAAALALAATDALAINKCVDKAGKVTYQNGRCPEDAKQEVVKVAPPADPAPAAAAPGAVPRAAQAPDADPEDPRMLDLVSVLVGYEGCVRASPDFAKVRAAQYDRWRAGNAKLLARLEHSARYQEILEGARKRQREEPDAPGKHEQQLRFCNVQFPPMLIRTTPR
jgi:hypothetical protein